MRFCFLPLRTKTIPPPRGGTVSSVSFSTSCMSNSFPSSSLRGTTANPPSSLRHAKHFTPFILSSAPFELANCRDRLFVESEVWALCHRDYSESLLVISSWEYNLNWAMWFLHDGLVCCTALNSHLHYNITLHRWLEVRAGVRSFGSAGSGWR